MAFLLSISFYLTLIIFFFGQLFRLNTHLLNIPLFDIFLIIFALIAAVPAISKKVSSIFQQPFFYFLIYTWANFWLNTLSHHYSPFPGVLYLIRLSCLILILAYPPELDAKKQAFLRLILFTNILFGIFQYFLWPDFTAFGALNWDPHLYRLVGTFFDPTFTAFIYLIFLIIVYLDKSTPKVFRFSILTIGYVALVLTYSRATYLSLFVASIYYSLKSKKITPAIFIGLLLAITTFILPRQPGEGTKLERTSSITAKIENYREGISLFINSPFIGYGYNNIVHARTIKNPLSHANSAFDGSILTIFITNGLIGGTLFLYGLNKYFHESSFFKQTILVSLFFHSLFANSLFYPWILFLIAII